VFESDIKNKNAINGGDFEEDRRLTYKELVERFRKKVSMIPQECWPAVFYWRLAVQTQKQRIRLANQLMQTVNVAQKVFWAEGIPDEIKATLEFDADGVPAARKLSFLKQQEDRFARLCEKEFKKTRWYSEVAVAAAEGEGMGPMIAGGLLWTIGSARRFPSFGCLVKYAGLDVVNGKAPKRRKGQMFTWNPLLRVTLFKLADVWFKNRHGIWRARWDAYDAWYRENRPEILKEFSKKGKSCGEGHIRNMARRKVQRDFLRNLYALWLEYEN